MQRGKENKAVLQLLKSKSHGTKIHLSHLQALLEKTSRCFISTNDLVNNSFSQNSAPPNISTISNDTNTTTQACEKSITTSVSIKTVDSNKSSEVLLSTATVYIYDNLGKFHEARALLDNESQSSFITKTICQRLT